MQSVGNMLFIQVDIVASSQQIFPSTLRRITGNDDDEIYFGKA